MEQAAPDAVVRHRVTFYERDVDLLTELTPFIASGLQRGDRVILLMTPARYALLVDSLGSPPSDQRGEVVVLDAETVLADVTRAGVFDDVRFGEALAPFITGDRSCRIYGELVSLLVERGLLEAAMALEAAGHELARQGVDILCGYDLRHLGRDRHDHVVSVIAPLHDQCVGAPPRTAANAPLVLLADDFEDARNMYAEYLRFSGIRVLTAADGSSAVRAALEHAPDLILMDVRMPGMTGIEAMQALRQHPRFRKVPTFALTAHALDSERAAILAAGFDSVISKPCLPDELVDVVRTTLDRSAWRAAAVPSDQSTQPLA